MSSNLAEKGKSRGSRRRINIGIVIVAAAVVTAAILTWMFIRFTEDFNNQVDAVPEIYTTEEFEDALADGSGDYLVYGTMTVENPVTSSETGGEYIYLTKETQIRTRTYSGTSYVGYNTGSGYSVGRGVGHYKYVWETTDVETQTCDSVILLGVEIPVSAFASPAGSNLVDTTEVSDNVQYLFYGVEAASRGTLNITIGDGSITDIEGFYPDMEPAEVKELLVDNTGVVSIIAMIAVSAMAIFSLVGVFALFIYSIPKDNPDSKKGN